jgi:hypothetical protein
MQKVDMETQSLKSVQGTADIRRTYVAPALVQLCDRDTESNAGPGADGGGTPGLTHS